VTFLLSKNVPKSKPMSKERLFKELIAQFAKDGNISDSEYAILIEKGLDLGFDSKAVDLLIQLELAEPGSGSFERNRRVEKPENRQGEETYTFKSAITRGGGVLTPDVIIIDRDSVTYRKRNKYLINVDSITVAISKISSVELDTSLLGTDIIIKTFGAGEIIGRKFTKSDAKQIRELIVQRQR
jgi:hypothetical protein